MSAVKEPATLRPDVETIMRRLKGEKDPYQNNTPHVAKRDHCNTEDRDNTSSLPWTKSDRQQIAGNSQPHRERYADTDCNASVSHSEFDQMKALVKTLGTRLKDAYAELAIKNESLSLLHLEVKKIEPLHAELCVKNEEIAKLRAQVQHSSDNNSQLVRLSLSNKQLEEEIHSLKCERSATLRQVAQQKEHVERIEKELATEKEATKEQTDRLSTDQKTIEKLLSTIEHQKVTINTLTEVVETLEKQLSLEKKTTQEQELSIATTQKTVEKILGTIEHQNSTIQFLTEEKELSNKRIQEACQEKEISDARIKEVEELLILKLQAIANLEEDVNIKAGQIEEAEQQLTSTKQENERLEKEVQKVSELNKTLSDRLSKLEQQLTKATSEITDSRKRIEILERLKKSAAEASAHAHAIVSLFEGSPKSLSFQKQSDETKGFEPSLFAEKSVQYDLF